MRMKIAAALLVVFAALAGCSSTDSASTAGQGSCDAKQKPVKAAVGFTPVFIPLHITLNSEGEVSVSLAASWTTPLGTVDLEVAKNDDKPSSPAVHRLAVSYRKDGRKLVDRYEIRCDRAYRVFLNGTFQARISTAETVIEAAPGVESTIIVVDAESPVGPNLKPLPEYQALPAARIDLPNPIAEQGLGADLDPNRMVVGNFVPGGLDSSDADLFWSYGDGLFAGYDAFLGTTTAATKTPQHCRRDASSHAAGKVPATALVAGKRFCVVTTRGHVALLTLAKVRKDSDDPDQRGLTFTVQRWLKT
ncbi:hypothetical protein [Kribbella sindirgiensis]|uniref:Uncharacterized protein n=1 Tax=Kribbella sindirgiensis TaxID=1124744 RepID=A0A4R0IWG0_9ACTN|nr:hypothetical protein [Kribbella sindirgiensis]TCC36944.1 hypothetical protein E0H50_09675 [Kribbella sindirgiensis]